MARVRPFQAYRYATGSSDISQLVAPPYDVIDDAQRAALLAREPHNIVALELPEGPLDPKVHGSRYETGAARWRQWRDEGVLARDVLPAIYVLEQRWTRGEREITRRAFVAAVGLEPFSAGVVLPHERTLPKALDDRLNLTRACAANLSQVLGLFPDEALESSAVFERTVLSEPLETATGDDGVESRIWAIDDAEDLAWIAGFFEDRTVFIADGHHRYTTALAYRDERRILAAEAGERPIDPAYDFVMMALANMDDPELLVLPTHRVADAAGEFDPDAFWVALSGHFDIAELAPGHPADVLSTDGPPAFIVATRDGRRRLVRVRAGVDLDSAVPTGHSSAWKHLDVAVLQELVLWPLLGIHPDKPETLDRLRFVKDAHGALEMSADHDVVFVLRPTRMDQMRAVALAGETMPQKSTYFYPKLLSGLLVRSAE